MLVIALTGGVGSGKSTVVDLFRAHGVPIIDTDQIARDLVAPGEPMLQAITSMFGPDFLNDDGSLNRSKLREYIFASATARKKLEACLHPLIHQCVMDRLKEIEAPYCLLVIPLLAESTQAYPHTRVLVIDADRATQLRRTIARDGIDETVANQMIDAQATREQRLAIADDVIDNTDGLEPLRAQVDKMHQKYLQLAKVTHKP